MPAPVMSKTFSGVVVSAGKMNGTVKVRIPGKIWNKKIGKFFAKPVTHLVSDRTSSTREGDIVAIDSGWRTSQRVRHIISAIITPFGVPLSERPRLPTIQEQADVRDKKRLAKDVRQMIRGRVVSSLRVKAAHQTGMSSRFGIVDLFTGDTKSMLETQIQRAAKKAAAEKLRQSLGHPNARIQIYTVPAVLVPALLRTTDPAVSLMCSALQVGYAAFELKGTNGAWAFSVSGKPLSVQKAASMVTKKLKRMQRKTGVEVEVVSHLHTHNLLIPTEVTRHIMEEVEKIREQNPEVLISISRKSFKEYRLCGIAGPREARIRATEAVTKLQETVQRELEDGLIPQEKQSAESLEA